MVIGRQVELWDAAIVNILKLVEIVGVFILIVVLARVETQEGRPG